MIKKLHSFVLRGYIGPLTMTFFIAIFVLLMQFLWKYIDELIGKGLEWYVIAELMAYAASSLVPMALPLAILLSSLMMFGNMGEHYELTALKSSGISLQKVMQPLIILGVVISIGAFLFSNYVLPYTNFKMGALLYDIRHQRPELNIRPGIFNYDVDGYAVKIEGKDKETMMMYDIMIYNHAHNFRGNKQVILADSGTMFVTEDERYLVFNLYSGNTYTEMREQSRRIKEYPHRLDHFEEQEVIVELIGVEFTRTDFSLFRQTYRMMNIEQLEHTIDSLSEQYNKSRNQFTNTLEVANYFKNATRITITDTLETPQTLPSQKDSIDPKTVEKQAKTDTITQNNKKELAPPLPRVRTEKKVKFIYQDPEHIKVPADLDSIFQTKTLATRLKILDWAANYARATQSYSRDMGEKIYRDRKNIRKHEIAWHEKYTLSFACFIFFFIGAPLGAIIRKGGLGMPVVVSVLLFIFYYIISLSGLKFAREAIIPSFVGMWLSSFILLPLGIFLTYKATTDSVIMNIDMYFGGIKKIFRVMARVLKIKLKD